MPAAEHQIFPDGCVSIIYHRNSLSGIAKAGITPLFTEASMRTSVPGDITWGMRISPAACATFVGMPPRFFRGQFADSTGEVPHLIDGLEAAMAEAKGFEDAVEIFEERAARLVSSLPAPDDKVAEVIDRICADGGDVRIQELAEMVALSPRQLQRRFVRSAGISAKEFARIRRIRAAASALVTADKVNWAERALETGFADQSHMIHEFAAVTGGSPTKFAERVRAIEHGRMID